MEKTVNDNSRNFELKEVLFFLVFFYICAFGFSAYTDLEEFKKDCANPITKECTSNIFYTSFVIGIPQIFGLDFKNKNIENK